MTWVCYRVIIIQSSKVSNMVSIRGGSRKIFMRVAGDFEVWHPMAEVCEIKINKLKAVQHVCIVSEHFEMNLRIIGPMTKSYLLFGITFLFIMT